MKKVSQCIYLTNNQSIFLIATRLLALDKFISKPTRSTKLSDKKKVDSRIIRLVALVSL